MSNGFLPTYVGIYTRSVQPCARVVLLLQNSSSFGTLCVASDAMENILNKQNINMGNTCTEHLLINSISVFMWFLL